MIIPFAVSSVDRGKNIKALDRDNIIRIDTSAEPLMRTVSIVSTGTNIMISTVAGMDSVSGHRFNIAFDTGNPFVLTHTANIAL